MGEELSVYLTRTPDILIYTLISHDTETLAGAEYSAEHIVTIHAGRPADFSAEKHTLSTIREANLCSTIARRLSDHDESWCEGIDAFVIDDFEYTDSNASASDDAANLVDAQFTGEDLDTGIKVSRNFTIAVSVNKTPARRFEI